MNPQTLLTQLDSIIPTAITGTVQETTGTTICVNGFPAPVGAIAEIRLRDKSLISAEVIGFRDEIAILYPLQPMHGIRRGDHVRLVQTAPWLTVGDGMLGKVLDARGRIMEENASTPLNTNALRNPKPFPNPNSYPLFDSNSNAVFETIFNSNAVSESNFSSSSKLNSSSNFNFNFDSDSDSISNLNLGLNFDLHSERIPFHREAPKAFQRPRITTPISTGVRAVDALLTLGEGQRVGIFAGSGVGKSTLLGMIARYSNADVIVIGLVGERGREVNDFLERDLGPEGRKRSVVIAATSDEPAILRVRAAQTATAVAEYFRDKGKNVLLLMDSLTRFAMAQREIGLAFGEPPAVLVEGDDENEPIADTVRGLLDGHIWLSRKLAAAGHYPAIDIPASISRLMKDICEKEHIQTAAEMRAMIALWREFQDLIAINAYRKGTNPALDVALEKKEQIVHFLRQNTDERSSMESAVREMKQILQD